jgi:predicted MFS family arabinose efflux permease
VANWRVLFLLSAPIALASWAGSFGALRESRAEDRSGTLDLFGAVLGTAVVASLVFGASFGSDIGWASAPIVGAFLAAAVLLPVFVRRCRVHPQPLLDLGVFTLPPVAVANVANFLLNFTSLANWLVWPLFFERVWGFSKVQTGLALLPGPVIGGVVTVLGGRLSERYGHERLVAWGAAIATVAVAWPVLLLQEEPNYLLIAPAMGLFGMGWSLTNPPLNSGVVSRVRPDLYGEVNAAFNTVRNIAAALGIAVAVTIVGPADRAGPMGAYRLAFVVLAVSVALCWAVLRFVYRRVGAMSSAGSPG